MRLFGSQEEYDLNPCQVIAFYDGKKCEFEIDLQFRNDNGILFFPDGMLKISVYSTQNLDKSYDQMNDKEKMVYYFLNCRDNGKTKMIENDEVIQTVEKRVETISDDCWTKQIEDFRIQQENELKLEFEEADKRLKEANKRLEEAQKRLEEANKKVQEANKRVDESDKLVDKMNQEMTQMIRTMLSNVMSVSQIAKSVSKSEEEIMKWISQPPVWWLFYFRFKWKKKI